jgi:hypothetical protein
VTLTGFRSALISHGPELMGMMVDLLVWLKNQAPQDSIAVLEVL